MSTSSVTNRPNRKPSKAENGKEMGRMRSNSNGKEMGRIVRKNEHKQQRKDLFKQVP